MGREADISSLDLAPRYEAAKEAQDKATEASTANYNKKRTMIAEVKQYKEQKEEMKQWERLRQNRVSKREMRS